MNLVVSKTAIAEPDARSKVSLPSAERAYTRSCFFEPGITATRRRRDKLYALRRVSNYGAAFGPLSFRQTDWSWSVVLR